MKKHFYILTFILLGFSSGSVVPGTSTQPARQSNLLKQEPDLEQVFTIDRWAKRKAKKHISRKVEKWKDGTPLHQNLIIKTLYANDTLAFSCKESDHLKNIFNSHYSWEGDTLHISGSFGLPRGEGFRIRIVKGKATLSHTLFSRDVYPLYAYTEKGEAKWSIDVECKKSKIVLSAIPDPEKKKPVYGYVEFKTADYYACTLSDRGKEIAPRTKQRKEMKIYFMSDFYEFRK